jgi:hypothetical protein
VLEAEIAVALADPPLVDAATEHRRVLVEPARLEHPCVVEGVAPGRDGAGPTGL